MNISIVHNLLVNCFFKATVTEAASAFIVVEQMNVNTEYNRVVNVLVRGIGERVMDHHHN